MRASNGRHGRIGIVLIWILVFAEHFVFGATDDRVSLLAALVHCAVGVGTLLLVGDPARRLSHLRWPGLWFAAAMLLAAATTFTVPASWADSHWQQFSDAAASISLDPLATRIGILRFIGYAALIVAGTLLADERLHAAAIIAPLLLGTLYAIWAIMAFRTDPGLILGIRRAPLGMRLSGSFLSPNTAGTLFAMLVAMSAFRLGALRHRFFARHDRSPHILAELFIALLAVLVTFAALLLTASRGAMIALVIAAIAIAALMSLRRPAQARGMSLLWRPGVIFLGLALLIPVVAARWALWESSWSEREVALEAFGHLVMLKPWLGYGIGTFEWQANLAMTSENAVALSWIGAVHNFYLQLVAEQGAIGAALNLLALSLLVARIMVALVNSRSSSRFIASIAAAIIVVAVHGLSDYALQIPSIVAMSAYLLGLATGTTGQRRPLSTTIDEPNRAAPPAVGPA